MGKNVEIELDINKLYRHEKGAYKVYCDELDRYVQTADDVMIETTNSEKALLVLYNGKTDKIFYPSCSLLEEKPLKLLRDI